MSSPSPSNCSSCIHCKSPLAKPDDVESGVCTRCYENIVLPAYKHVESLQPDDPGRMMWHGWAVREAFIAGALHAKTNAEVSDVCPPLASDTEKPRTGTRSLH